MRRRLLKTCRLALLLAGLACVSFVSGREPKAPASESMEGLRGRAEKGDAAAQNILGTMYENGEGIEQDYTEAARWYRRAAEQGYAGAQTNLGIKYHEGQGVTQDDAEAIRWFRRAAEQDVLEAQSYLGVMYYHGRGVPETTPKQPSGSARPQSRGTPHRSTTSASCTSTVKV